MARRALDQYYTDESAVRTLMDRAPQIQGAVLGDPCCGDGRMARMLAPRFRHVLTNDVNPLVQADAHEDAVAWMGTGVGLIDWYVTNPPFFAAGDIARGCLDTAAAGVALLLRCSFLEPCGPSHTCRKARHGKPAIPCSPHRCLRNGRKWIAETPPTRLISIPRMSFTGDGKTDNVPVWWFIWERAPGGAWTTGSIEVADLHTGQLGLAIGG